MKFHFKYQDPALDRTWYLSFIMRLFIVSSFSQPMMLGSIIYVVNNSYYNFPPIVINALLHGYFAN